jgi:hypothetical protein
MYQWMHYVLYTVFLITLILTIFYSIKYRRQKADNLRGLFAARMNINMGIMLVCISLFQFLFFNFSNTRVVFGAIILLLGLFNFFAGVRNHSLYQNMKP